MNGGPAGVKGGCMGLSVSGEVGRCYGRGGGMISAVDVTMQRKKMGKVVCLLWEAEATWFRLVVVASQRKKMERVGWVS